MRTRALSLTLAAALIAISAIVPQPIHAQDPAPTAPRTGYAEANGVRYYYEVHGTAETAPGQPPLLLLHGGLGSIDMFGPILARFTAARQVVAVDLHGHGRTALGARSSIDLKAMGDDLDAVLAQLGFGQVDVLGYSMGGGVAFRLAVQHPERVRRLVLASTIMSPDGSFPELRPMQAAVGAGMAESMRETPMYVSYMRVAPVPGDFPRLLDGMGALMREEYDWMEDLRGLTMPTMLVFGDSDMMRPEHVVEMYQALGGGLRDAGWMREHMSPNRLAILPDVTHYELFASPMLPAVALPFLNGESHAPSWAAQVQQ